MAKPGGSKTEPLSSSTFDSYYADIQSAALGATKHAAALPADIGFHRSVDKDFSRAVESCSDRVLALTNKFLRLVSTTETSRSKGKAKLEDQDDVMDNFDTVVVSAMDHLFERADICLDEYLGRSKPVVMEVNLAPALPAKSLASRPGRLDPKFSDASHLPKPQLKFKTKVDNFDTTAWSPKLRHKFNARVPLGYNLQTTDADGDVDMSTFVPHPYRFEIENISYPSHMFEKADIIPMRSFEDTPFTWVDTKEGLEALLGKLRAVQEIAIDLEHHSYRTFAGFLCLMQISTREEDFIVDTLALREELEDLNEVFTNPQVVKVLHGAERDIVWLQQDFNLYIVNLFDTFHASKVLEFPRHGLAALLETYCNIMPDKRFQLADWRIRPLPQEMLHYARSDTHFLLYIFDKLRHALLDRPISSPSAMQTVLERSQQTALRTHTRNIYDEEGDGPGGWRGLAMRWNKTFSGIPLNVFRRVHAWRDRIAREHDEGIRYVLPDHFLFQLAEHPPVDMASLLATVRPLPPLVRTAAKDLLDSIQAAVKEDKSPIGTMLVAQSVNEAPASTLLQGNTDHMVNIMTVDTTAVPNDFKRLWGTSHSNALAHVASSSSLLGSKSSSARPSRSPHSSAQSALFPSAGNRTSTKKIVNARYHDVVARIHSALVIAPSVPKILEVAAHKSPQVVESAETVQDTPLVPEQIEIPYIPASHRKQPVSVIDDTVVVVGQARQRKRKRVKQQLDADAGIDVNADSKESTPGASTDGSARKKSRMKAKETAGAAVEEPEPFDYASVPNMLDEQPEGRANTVRKQKQKQKKGGTFDYSGFSAPPRAYSELKGGNRSQTFR